MQFIDVSTIPNYKGLLPYVVSTRSSAGPKGYSQIVNKHGNKEVSSAPQLICGNNNDVIINNNQYCQMSLVTRLQRIKIII